MKYLKFAVCSFILGLMIFSGVRVFSQASEPNTVTVNGVVYTLCAAEGGTCSFSGSGNVVFGVFPPVVATAQFNVNGPFTNSVSCVNNVVSQTDPAVGADKSCWVNVAAANTCPPPPPPANTPSASGTTIPTASQIVDASLNIWTVSAGVVNENGSAAGFTQNVSLLLYFNGVIYQQNTAGNWWSWTGTTWATSSDPRTSPPPPPPPPPPSGAMSLVGINLAGAEFGSTTAPPSAVGSSFTYPTQQEVDYYHSKGMTVIRLPFELSRLMLTPGATSLNAQTLTALQNVVSWAAADNMTVLLDPHDYGLAWGNEIGAGSPSTSNAQFAKFWSLTAAAFKNSPNVIFGIMNEPNEQTAVQWQVSNNAAIAAIRAAGATQEILIPGTSYTGAWTWTSGSGNSAAINPSTIQDPLNNYAIEVHQYLDVDGSGSHTTPITNAQLGVQRLTAVTNWALTNHVRLFLGEIGVPPDSQSLTALDNMLAYMKSSGAWQGVTYWAGGPWWGGCCYTIEPTNGLNPPITDQPQMAILHKYIP